MIIAAHAHWAYTSHPCCATAMARQGICFNLWQSFRIYNHSRTATRTTLAQTNSVRAHGGHEVVCGWDATRRVKSVLAFYSTSCGCCLAAAGYSLGTSTIKLGWMCGGVFSATEEETRRCEKRDCVEVLVSGPPANVIIQVVRWAN